MTNPLLPIVVRLACVLAFCTILVGGEATPSGSDGWVIELPRQWRAQPAQDPAVPPRAEAWGVSDGLGLKPPRSATGKEAPARIDSMWLEQRVAIPPAWAGRRLALDFQRVEGDAVLFVNGRRIGEVLRPGGQIDLGPVDGLGGGLDLRLFVTRTYTGISRGADQDVLRKLARSDLPVERWRFGVSGVVRAIARLRPAAITDVWMQTSWRRHEVAAEIDVVGEAPQTGARLSVAVRDADGRIVRTLQATVDLPVGISRHRLVTAWPDPIPWQLDAGHLYRAEAALDLGGGRIDRHPPQRFGFREIWSEGRNLLMNGRTARLRMGVLGLIGLTAESLPFYRAMGCDAAAIQAHPNLWWRDRAESPLLDEALLDACDAAGFALFVPAPALGGLRERLADDPAVAAAYAAEMRAWQRRWRNHPCIVAWTVGMNTYNPRDAIAAPGMGRRYVGDQARAGMVRAIAQACAISRDTDPTRLAFSHADGNCGDLASTNLYLNLVPLQERMEWPVAWAEGGDMPYHAAEFGPPYTANYWKGKRFLLSEYLAIQRGDEAFAREGEEGLRTTAALSAANTGGHGAFDRVDAAQFPAYWEVLGEIARWTDRSWRTFGVNGGMGYWEFDYGDPPGYVERRAQRRATIFNRYELATGVVPGQRPAWANPSFDIRRAGNLPFLGWIAGAPRHTDRTHLYAAGEAIAKQAALIWDGPGATTVEARWSLVDGTEREVAGGDVRCALEPGAIRLLPITCTAPPVAARTDLTLRLRGRQGGAAMPEDRFPLTVFPPRAGTPPVPRVTAYDPAGLTTAWLRTLGVTVTPWNGSAPAGELLVVGREALRAGGPVPWTAAAVAAGARILVLEQRPEVWRALGFRIETANMPRQVFARRPTPVMEGLEDADLSYWRGAPDLLPAGETQPGDVPYAPKWTNTHAVASLALRIPRCVGFRTHLACEFDLDFTPLLEQRIGAGAVWYATLDLTGRVDGDPAASRLAANLLRCAAAAPPVPCRTVRHRGTPDSAAALVRIGVAVDATAAAPGDLLVIGTGAGPAVVDEVRRHVAAGGTALLLALPADELARHGFQARSGTIVRTEPEAHPLVAGIPRGWLRWRAPLATDLLVREGQPADTTVLLGGLAAWRAVGPGGIAVLQAHPGLLAGLTGEAIQSAQPSVAHLHQLVAAVLTGLGAQADRRVAERLAICDLGPGWAPVASWHVLGPFPVQRDDGQAMLLTAGAVGEASAIAGDTNPNLLYDDGAGAKRDWRRILQADGEGRVDLARALGRETLAVAWLTTEITSGTERTAILRLGADWRLRAWVNGSEVFRSLSGGNRRAAHLVEVPLRRGVNVVTLKVGAGSKGFACWADCDRPRPADAPVLPDALRGVSIYAGATDADEFDPYEFHYW